MYEDFREKRPVDIVINAKNYLCKSLASPTIFTFKDSGDTCYFFRSRHGLAYLECEDTGELLADGYIDEELINSFEDVIRWARTKGIKIKKTE